MFYEFFEQFGYGRVLLSTIGAMNFPAASQAGTATLFPKHVQSQLMVTKGTLHDNIPVITSTLLSDQPTPKARLVTIKKIINEVFQPRSFCMTRN